MIDFHSHILADMDDGSRNVDESVQMLRQSSGMGIDTIVATPHYYSNRDTISNYLSQRNERYQILMNELKESFDVPEIVLGAEVAFFSGMSREKDITRLCIDKTRYMLLEMPFFEWSSLTVSEIKSLIASRGITPIIAHIERYFSIQQKNGKIDEILDLGVIFQTNSEALTDGSNTRKILKMIDANKIHLLGSDCHNAAERPPNLDHAFKIIGRKLGNSALKKIDTNGRKILNDKWI